MHKIHIKPKNIHTLDSPTCFRDKSPYLGRLNTKALRNQHIQFTCTTLKTKVEKQINAGKGKGHKAQRGVEV
jgi:hypothetical protein